MSILKKLLYGEEIYYILKGEYDPRAGFFSFEHSDTLFIYHTMADHDVTGITFDKIDRIITKEEYDEMTQPPTLYKRGDQFHGPNGITFRIVAIYNDKYLILIRKKDGVRAWSYTTEYRITKVATKVA